MINHNKKSGQNYISENIYNKSLDKNKLHHIKNSSFDAKKKSSSKLRFTKHESSNAKATSDRPLYITHVRQL